MYNWQDKCYQFLRQKGFNKKDAGRLLFYFVKDNLVVSDFHFDVDTRVNEEELIRVLILLTKYYNTKLYIYEYEF